MEEISLCASARPRPSQYISDVTGQEMLDHLASAYAHVPACVFLVTNRNLLLISFPRELIGFAMVAPSRLGGNFFNAKR